MNALDSELVQKRTDVVYQRLKIKTGPRSMRHALYE